MIDNLHTASGGADGPVIELKGLHKKFGELRVIKGLDLAVRHGERHALIGPNGAGKSTLFALISGLMQPTSGEILLREEYLVSVRSHLINREGDVGRSFQITTSSEFISRSRACPHREAFWPGTAFVSGLTRTIRGMNGHQ